MRGPGSGGGGSPQRAPVKSFGLVTSHVSLQVLIEQVTPQLSPHVLTLHVAAPQVSIHVSPPQVPYAPQLVARILQIP
jgi:hypothetical protein